MKSSHRVDDMAETKARALDRAVAAVIDDFVNVPWEGFGAFLRVQACLIGLVTLANVSKHLDEDPYPGLLEAVDRISRLARSFDSVFPHLRSAGELRQDTEIENDRTAELFQTAWTAYDDETYDHSLILISDRLRQSGFDETYFTNKVCFDGGCGTGRLSIAMAQAGASRVVAADIGGESLAYFTRVRERYGLHQIEIVEQDVTDLGHFGSDSFDFVASHGVLHHTHNPDRGIREHFRITRPGGVLWLYLYGAEGIYWPVYDRLKALVASIEPKTIREILTRFRIRRGLIYTFLDNLLAPRVYYRRDTVLELLRPFATFEVEDMRGSSPIDDTAMLLGTKWGREVFGPDGEIRLIIAKRSPHRDPRSRVEGVATT